MRWHRELTQEDVATARAVRELHIPSEPDALGRRKCVSALHLITPPSWPCEQINWSDAVLVAEARGEIPADES